MVKNRWIKAAFVFLCAFLMCGFITMFVAPAEDVFAASSTVSSNIWGEDEGQVSGVASGFDPNTQYCTITLVFGKSEVYCSSLWGCTIISGGDGSDTVTIRTTAYNSGWGISVNGTNIQGMSVTVSGTSVSQIPGVEPTNTNTPTPRPTTAARATNTPRPTATPAAPTVTTAPVAPVATVATATPVPAAPTATTAPAATATPVPVASDQTDAPVAETPETTIETTVEETEATEELPPDGEEVAPESDDQIVEGDDDSATPDDGEGDGTPTPTRRTAVGGVIRKDNSDGAKKAFPWWILIVLAILGAAGYRYRQLSNENYSGMELVCEFIPGGVIGNVVDKVAPNLRKPATPATPKEDEPVVVNGYLKTSNTKSIRPVYSNAPQTRGTRGVTSTATKAVTPVTPIATKAPMAAKTAAATTATPKKPVQQRPPVKRPASLSSNKAVAEAAKAEAAAKTPVANEVTVAEARAKAEAARVEANKAEAEAAAIAAGKVVEKTVEKKAEPKTAPAANKVPLQQRPPIKRPASLSSNRAAVAAAAKGATATPEQVKASAKPSPFEGKKVAESKPVQQRPPVKRPSSATQRPMVKRPTGAATAAAAAKAADTSKENKQTGIKASGTPDSYFIPMKNPEQQEKINPFKAIDNNPSASDEN